MSIVNAMIDKILLFIFKKNKKAPHIYNYTKDSLLIESGHVPHMAFRLIEGVVIVLSKNKIIGKFGPHTSWGINEIRNDKTAKYTVCIKKNSKIFAVGKSELETIWMRLINFFAKDMLDQI